MGRIRILQVQYGDAIIIECSGGDFMGVIVVDGGPTTSSDYFLDALSDLPAIDLMVLTHYDEDHIGGILSLVYDCLDKQAPLPVKEIWANCAQYVPMVGSTRTSPGQGVDLAKYLTEFVANSDLVWRDRISEGYCSNTIHFAEIEVVSPTVEVMIMAIKKQKIEDGAPTKATARTNADLKISLDDLAEKNTKAPDLTKDSQLANAASIAFILRSDEFSVLMLGDCYPQNVEAYLRGKGWSEDHPLEVDFVKVSHHGSRNNTSNGLMDIIKCNKFIISTNGGDGRYAHPDRETFAHILCHPKRNKEERIHFYLNYSLEEITTNGASFLNDGEKEQYNFEIHENTTELCF